MSALRLATRRSPLALIQANVVRERLAALGVESRLVEVDTHGDRDPDTSLADIGGQGLFAVEVQLAVLAGEADVAVHSAKDLPATTLDGLDLCAVPERRDAADALVGRSLAGLGPGATVATGSPRRRALLLERRPDLNVVGLRGNMGRRLDVAGRDGVDAVVVAVAALERLGETARVAERLDPEWFVPQVAQGALALEARAGDSATLDTLRHLDDEVAHRCVVAERAFLRELGAGCSIPAGAHAVAAGSGVTLRAVMLAVDGSTSARGVESGTDPEDVGRSLARSLRDAGGGGQLAGWGGA
ncbi:MAG: hydroxymethylbilane synthase [Acidimicrobiales bacterium]